MKIEKWQEIENGQRNRTVCHTFHANKYTRIYTSTSYFSPLFIQFRWATFWCGKSNSWLYLAAHCFAISIVVYLELFFFFHSLFLSLSLYLWVNRRFPPSLICPLIFILNLFSAWIVHYYTSIKLDNRKWQQQQEGELGNIMKNGKWKYKKKQQQRRETTKGIHRMNHHHTHRVWWLVRPCVYMYV